LNFEHWNFDIVSDFDIRIFNLHTYVNSQNQGQSFGDGALAGPRSLRLLYQGLQLASADSGTKREAQGLVQSPAAVTGGMAILRGTIEGNLEALFRITGDLYA